MRRSVVRDEIAELQRQIAEKKAAKLAKDKKASRREELMIDPSDLQKIWLLRKAVHDMDDIAAMELLFDRMKQTKTNAQFFDAMKRN